jgi:Viral BACON domain
MNRCLHCSRPCSGSSTFCNECLASLQKQAQRDEHIAKYEGVVAGQHLASELTPAYTSENAKRSAHTVAISPPHYSQKEDGFYAEKMSTRPGDDMHGASLSSRIKVPGAPGFSLPSVDHPAMMKPLLSNDTVPMELYTPEDAFSPQYESNNYDAYNNDHSDVADRSFERLNDAARLMEEADPEYPPNGRGPRPRASRLAPLRDISADIRRESTPLPNASFATQPVAARKVVARKGLDEHLPDLWPWLHMTEVDESKDEWIDQVDPLLARRFPSNVESMKIEQEDMRRALSERIAVVWEGVKDGVKHEPQKCLRILFISLSIFAALALMIDTVMVAILEQRTPAGQVNQLPMMTLSTRVVKPGGEVTIQLSNFPPLTSIVLSHDIQESVSLKNQAGVIKVNAQGSKNVVILIDDSWEVGQHTIVAEDVQTRYTASAMLQVGSGPMPPSHLEISTSDLNLGSQYVGANSFQKLNLKNGGGGIINWSASSSSSWLMFSPKNGVFSDHQAIQIAADRTNLTPGTYHGKITIISNVSQPQDVSVQMVVLALPKNAGAVMSVTPAIMTYIVGDGQGSPGDQSLMITNPGTKALHWSLSSVTPQADTDESSYLSALDMTTNWLSTGATSGIVAPGSTEEVVVKVNSQSLLPGTYTSSLKFVTASGYTALNSPQLVNVTLTVQPRCSILLSTGSLTFTAIAGQSSTGNQVLSLTGSASCSNVMSWHTTSTVPWLAITPTDGQIKGAEQAITTVAVNPANLHPGSYTGTITIAMAQSTQTVNIQLTVQNPPAPSAPIIGVSPLNLNFSLTKGQADPAAQTVTLTNTGRSSLIWNATANPTSSWLNVTQNQGRIASGQTGNLVISVSANGLTAGTYVGQIVLSGVDPGGNPASGSPQTVNVTFTVLAPCTLAQPSTSALAFSSTQGSADPSAQPIVITASGNCNWPVTWQTSNDASASWLNLSSGSGTFTTSGQSATLMVTPNNAGLLSGSYHARVKISAIDSTGATLHGSPQSLSIDFTVQPPCTLQVSSTGLIFSVVQGQSSSSQSIPLSSTGNCSLPLSWSAHVDSTWLQLSSTSGNDNGSGSSVGVNVNASGLNIGAYTGVVSLSAVGSGGANVVGNLQVPVTLNVTGSRINVAVNMCQDATCAAPSSMAGALVSLADTSGNIVASGTADNNGNVALTNISLGNYTILASGDDAAGNTYTGSSTIMVTGSSMSITINAMPLSSTIIVPVQPTDTPTPSPTDTPTPIPTPTSVPDATPTDATSP